MKAYICKYWETRGVFPMEGEVSECGRYFHVTHEHNYMQTFTESEWATDLGIATGKAYAKRDAKLKSVRKHLDKLTRMTIKVEQ